jgi:hypothetical protein
MKAKIWVNEMCIHKIRHEARGKRP